MAYEVRHGYVSGHSGRLFRLEFLPAGGRAAGRAVIYCPPFGEEMNKCRNLVNRQARALAMAGFAVTVPDLFGTGDSDGDISGASWSRWRQDICDVLQNTIAAEGPGGISLWGVRLGCLLAAEVCRENPGSVDHLVLWQPVLSGRQAVSQLVRLGAAASMQGNGAAETSTGGSPATSSHTLMELGGYEVPGSLLKDIEGLDLRALLVDTGADIDWVEICDVGALKARPGAQRLIDQVRAAGRNVSVHCAPAPQFWSTVEIADAPDLIEFTTNMFTDRPRRAFS